MDVQIEMRRMLLIVSTVVGLMLVFQYFELLGGQHLKFIRVETGVVRSTTTYVVHVIPNDTSAYCLEEESEFENESRLKDTGVSDDDKEENLQNEFIAERGVTLDKNLTMNDCFEQIANFKGKFKQGNHQEADTNLNPNEVHDRNGLAPMPLTSSGISTNNVENYTADSRFSIFYVADNTSSISNIKKDAQTKQKNTEKNVSVVLSSNSIMSSNYIMKKKATQPTSISQMNSLLFQSYGASSSKRPKWPSARDQDLLSAKLIIENAPVLKSTPELYASLYRNASIFKRSYKVMESILKVYVYQEGEKPLFHQPKLDGIYASEGWFIKLMEENKQFVVRDPRKAHLFFLPFSVKKLRTLLDKPNSHGWRDLIGYLDNYVDMIAGKYIFWNRTGGADHFLVACHDWALRVTGKRTRNSIRALCNANTERGFKIGKDTTLPVTYVRKMEEPLRDIGGNPASERPTLAFFAGSMHGYLRPILLQYWENKEPDMKIFGSLPRDSEGKKVYRDHMRSSKYCVCARGYEVHTPRIVEAIFHGCVPVVISDNYVPPFFEVLNWEAFAVFVPEKDVPNLRNILLSIPENKYLSMQRKVKMVQRHFLWHKNPIKYDLFHMILHSVWYTRVSNIKLT